MALYNRLTTIMRCPRCGNEAEMIIDLYFGCTDLLDYRLGDLYRWVPRKIPKNGGRPEGGNLNGEGYTECPVCHRDFFVIVHVRDDKLISVEPDLEKTPYIPG